jgi:hypothetical protein
METAIENNGDGRNGLICAIFFHRMRRHCSHWSGATGRVAA